MGQRFFSYPRAFGDCTALGLVTSSREENDGIFFSPQNFIHSSSVKAQTEWGQIELKKQRIPVKQLKEASTPFLIEIALFPHLPEPGYTDCSKSVSSSAWLYKNTLAKRNTFFLWFLLPAKCHESFKFKQSVWRRIYYKSKNYCLRNSSTFTTIQ